MFFRNLSCYRFTSEINLDALAAKLQNAALRPVGPLELATMGFVPPLGDGPFAHWVGDAMLVSAAQQERLLPSDVINRSLNDRLKQITADEGRKVGSKERKRIKEELFTLMLPQAFVRQRRTNLYFTRDGWLVIDHGSRKIVESIITQIRNAAGSFPCVPMAPEESPRALMTHWVVEGVLPGGLLLGDQIELRDPVEAGAVVRCSNQDLESDEIREHIACGKQVFRLALVFNDRISFVLDEALCVHKVRFLDAVQDAISSSDREHEVSEAHTTFTLMSLELKLLLAWMETTFGISPAPKLKLDGGDAAPEMRKPTQAKFERAVELTAKMYEARKTAREFLGHKFAETMESSGAAIRKRAKKDGTTDTQAAVSLATENQHKNAGYTSLWILAALVEMSEPSDPTSEPKAKAKRALKDLDTKAVGDALTKSMRAKGHNVRVSVTVGTNLGMRLDAQRVDLPESVRKYLNEGERGASADTMFARLAGVSTAGCALSHPLDPSDLRRCRLVLELIPEFAPRIDEMSSVSEPWAALVNVWGTLCATMDEECPKWREGEVSCPATMEFMQEIGC